MDVLARETRTNPASAVADSRGEAVVCDGCGAHSPRLSRCACKTVRYCGVKCQAAHRAAHRASCHSILDRGASTATAEPRAAPALARFEVRRFVHADIDLGCMFGVQSASHPFLVPNPSTGVDEYPPHSSSSSSSSLLLLRQVDPVPSARVRVHDRDCDSEVTERIDAAGRDDPPTERKMLEQWHALVTRCGGVDELVTHNHSYLDSVDGTSDRSESKDRAPVIVPSVSECARADRDAIASADLEFRYLNDETTLLDLPLFRVATFVSGPSPMFEIATPSGLASRLREISDAAKPSGVGDSVVAASAPSREAIAALASTSAPHPAETIVDAVATPRVVTLDCSAFVQILARLRRERRGEQFAHLTLTVGPRLAHIDARIVVMRFTDAALRTHIEGAGASAEINQYLLLPECVPPAFATADTPATGLDGDGVRTLTLRDWARRRRATVAKRMCALAPDRYFKSREQPPPRSYLHGQLAQLAFASCQAVAFTTLGRSCSLALCA